MYVTYCHILIFLKFNLRSTSITYVFCNVHFCQVINFAISALNKFTKGNIIVYGFIIVLFGFGIDTKVKSKNVKIGTRSFTFIYDRGFFSRILLNICLHAFARIKSTTEAHLEITRYYTSFLIRLV